MRSDDHDKFREKLLDWKNKDEVGTRFPVFYQYGIPKPICCPKCGGRQLLSDDWPPNYGGGSSGYGSEMYGAFKIICMDCLVHFSGSSKVVHDHLGALVSCDISYGGPVDLVPHERHLDKLLTPHDVRQEEYFDKHGEYRRLSWRT